VYALLALGGEAPRFGPLDPDGPFLETLMRVNFFLLVFNLFPAFPMDGGRVLRALLASKIGLVAGTRVAARFGQTSAVIAGLYALTAGQPLLALISLFVFLGAGAEAAAVETRVAGEGLNVDQMMVTHFRTIPVYATLSDAVELLLSSEQREFPVVDNTGRVEGVLTRDNLIKGISQRGPSSTVGEAMTTQVSAVSPRLGFQEALERLRSSGLPALPVVDESGRLVGLLTLDNITDLLLVRRARA
jgi:CBS domain-containing protein